MGKKKNWLYAKSKNGRWHKAVTFRRGFDGSYTVITVCGVTIRPQYWTSDPDRVKGPRCPACQQAEARLRALARRVA